MKSHYMGTHSSCAAWTASNRGVLVALVKDLLVQLQVVLCCFCGVVAVFWVGVLHQHRADP